MCAFSRVLSRVKCVYLLGRGEGGGGENLEKRLIDQLGKVIFEYSNEILLDSRLETKNRKVNSVLKF